MRHPFAAVALLLSAPVMAATATFEFDPAHTAARFAAKHMMVSTVRGELGKVEGAVVIDDKDITKSTVTATIDTTALNTREPKRDAHLKSPDFLDVAKYPTLTFKSKKVQKGSAPHQLKVIGDLTIRGVTKEIPLDVQLSDKELKDPTGLLKRGVTATARINRKDFGLTWNVPLETGGVLVGEEVDITIDAELQRKAEQKSAAATR